MRFVDQVRIVVRAGRGGDGAVAWRREAKVPKGGPAGGDGGRGGDVILVADPHLSTLLDLHYRRILKAESGRPGGIRDRNGRGGEDLVVRVPVGTVVFIEGEAEDSDAAPRGVDEGGMENVYLVDDDQALARLARARAELAGEPVAELDAEETDGPSQGDADGSGETAEEDRSEPGEAVAGEAVDTGEREASEAVDDDAGERGEPQAVDAGEREPGEAVDDDAGERGEAELAADDDSREATEADHHSDDEHVEDPAAEHDDGLIPAAEVLELEFGERLGDLTEPHQQLVVARGGRGGRGNIHFRSSTNRAPDRAEPGAEGEAWHLRLELKLLADVGIVGFPNVGKSTFIRRVSRARPKVGAYPFTTLIPNLGVVQLPGNRSMVVADVPGLIRGASEGKGLGHHFLRHLERTRVLLHLLAPDYGPEREPLADLDALEQELQSYGTQFDGRPRVVALNKLDLLGDEEGRALVARTRAALRERNIPLFTISAQTGAGIPKLLEALWRRLERDGEA